MGASLEELQREEDELQLDSFDEEVAWRIGSWLVDHARRHALPVTVDLRRAGHQLFHVALPGTSADNDAWVERKVRLVMRTGHSTAYVRELLAEQDGSIEQVLLLPEAEYAPHGGCLPIRVRGTGLVGTLTVSGLPQHEDHALVVLAVRTYLGTADPVTPDTKDWTWVLDRPCPQCGFDSRDVTPSAVPQLLRAQADDWVPVLARPDVRDRPAPGVWSPLEYACHVRDVYRVFAGRLQRMLTDDAPVFDNWDQDAAARDGHYAVADPRAVADEVTAAAGLLAEAFADVADTDWQRAATRSDGAQFTVLTLARYLLHDPAHHLWDVGAAPRS
jgi:uncharacterized protein (UPF0303 family)